jgi:hypothetical protein
LALATVAGYPLGVSESSPPAAEAAAAAAAAPVVAPAPAAGWRPPTALLLCAVLAAGAAVRAVNGLQVKDGSILQFHVWEQSDMNFFHQWGRRIAEGDLLGAPRPYHRWHGEVALEVHQRQRPGEPFDERRGRELWNRWLGDKVYYQDPLYAYLLGGLYRLFGPRVEPMLLLQSLMGLAITALVFWLGATLGGRVTGFVSGLLAAFYAPLVFNEGTLLRGVLLALLSLGLVAAARRALDAARPARWWLLGGLSGGLLVLTHSAGLLLVLALAALVAWAERDARRRHGLLAFSGGLLLGLAPLVVRNLSVGLPPFAATATGPVNFILCNAADRNAWAGFSISKYAGEILEATNGKLLPVVRATLATHDGIGSWLRLGGEKLLVFLSGHETVDNVSFDYYLLQAPFVAAVGLRFALVESLAVAGMLLAGRRLRAAAPLLVGIAAGLATALAFATLSRLRLTTALLLIPFAGYALVEGWRRLRQGRARSLIGPALAAALIAALALVPGPRVAAVRDSDYWVGNTIALHQARERARDGDLDGALRTLRVQLRTEPRDLQRLEPTERASTLTDQSARVAPLFVDLHSLAAAVHEQLGEHEEALREARRAGVLQVVAQQYRAQHPQAGS